MTCALYLIADFRSVGAVVTLTRNLIQSRLLSRPWRRWSCVHSAAVGVR